MHLVMIHHEQIQLLSIFILFIILQLGMGSQDSKPTQIKVATLNYSGILKSPYQFYQKYDKHEIELSNNMKEMFEEAKNQFQFASFEKQWQETRYSPLYVETCGIKHNIYMMSKIQFQNEWDNWRKKEEKNLLGIFDKYLQKKLKELKELKEKKEKGEKKEKKEKVKNQPQGEQPQILTMEEYLGNLKLFDFLVYKAILKDVYKEKQEENEIESKFMGNSDSFLLDSRKYRENRRIKFGKSFLNQQLKISKTLKVIDAYQLDVLFIQEANQLLITALEQKSNNLHIVRSYVEQSNKLSSQSIIIIKHNKEKFPKFKTLMQQNTRLINNVSELKDSYSQPRYLSREQIKRININNDTVVQFLYNIILISPHLSSKPKNNQQQIKTLKDVLGFLKTTFTNCHIIVGGDLNSKSMASFQWKQSEQSLEKHCFNVVPADCSEHFTCYKKRTSLQAQKLKANETIKQVKDYIITDLEIKQASIETANGEIIFKDCTKKVKKQQKIGLSESNNYQSKGENIKLIGDTTSKVQVKQEEQKLNFEMPLMPSDNHPYDHYLVIATIVINQKLEHVTDIDYRFKYRPESLTQQQLNIIYHEKQKRNMPNN